MIGTSFYAGLLVLVVAAWPFLLAEIHPALVIVVAALNLGVLVLVWRSRSTPACSYWQGLKVIAGSMMSGSANITLLYGPIVLAVVYMFSIVYAVQGFQNDQRHASTRWEQLVLWFYNRRVRD